MPQESYPRYSRYRRPASTTCASRSSPATYPKTPHMVCSYTEGKRDEMRRGDCGGTCFLTLLLLKERGAGRPALLGRQLKDVRCTDAERATIEEVLALATWALVGEP